MAHRRRGEAPPDLGERGPARRQRRPGVLQRGGGADVQRAVGVGRDAAQRGHAGDPQRLADVAELLVDPQRHVGGAGDDARLGPGQALRGEVLQRHLGGLGGERIELRAQRGTVDRCVGQLEHALGRVDDRTVAGAAAQVAGQRVGDGRALGAGAGGRMRLAQRGHRHDEAGRAEAALRAVALDQRLLHRMRLRQVFHGDDGAAVERGQEAQAGVDIADRHAAGRGVVALGHQHGAGAAVALVAAFLGAGAARAGVLAQPVEQRAGGRHAFKRDGVAAVDEADRSGRDLGHGPEHTPADAA